MTTTPDALPQASGPGAELFDDRAIFYLAHRQQIDAWSALRGDVSAATTRFLHSLSDQVGATLPTWDTRSEVVAGYEVLLLCPSETPIAVSPIVGLGLGWKAKTVMPDADPVMDATTPFAAVWINRQPSGASAGLATAMTTAISEVEIPPGFRAGTVTAVYRYEQASPNWWTDLDAYAHQLVEAVRVLAAVYAGPIAAAVERRSSPT